MTASYAKRYMPEITFNINLISDTLPTVHLPGRKSRNEKYMPSLHNARASVEQNDFPGFPFSHDVGAAHAQDRGSVSGTLTDTSGAPFPGASVTLQIQQQALPRRCHIGNRTGL